jgi:hypothetical protein
MLEDYIPEPDWGDVKFYHNKRPYKIFYGQELSNVYDYLMLFQMLYLPFDNEYKILTGRSPTKELAFCLLLQDKIISGIKSQIKFEELSGLSPGHIEIPSFDFWESALKFYSQFDVRQLSDETIIKTYSIEMGALPQEQLDCGKFRDLVHSGKVLPKYFVVYEEQYLPILPRRYSAILFDSWGRIFEKYHDKVGQGGISYSLSLSAEVHNYIKARLNCNFLEPAVSAVTPEGHPHKVLFSSVFISKNRLILVYTANPLYSVEKTEEELRKISDDLKEAIELVSKSPHTLALHVERQNVQFQSKTEERSLSPELIVIIPQTDTAVGSLKIPVTFPGKIMFMDQFLGIMDELDNPEMFSSFLEYWEEYGEKTWNLFIAPLDIFGSFKDSFGVLLEGAVDYDMVSIDPHWGSNMRYKTLSEFWNIYPEVHFFDHPRSWRLKKETETRVRLESRGYFGCALYCKVGLTHVFINAPFDKMTYEQGLLSNLLMECLEDSLSINIPTIMKHCYFQYGCQFQVLFFPVSLITSNKGFDHLKHFIPCEDYWRTDSQMILPGIVGIRVVFNDKRLIEAFETVEDRSIEVNLLSEILKRLDDLSPDEHLPQLLELFEVQKQGKPRFKVIKANKKVSFPEFVNPHKPQPVHFKKAKKRISELAKQQGFNEGQYSLEDAKVRIDAIKKSIIEEIDTEVSKYDFKLSIPFLLTRNDALMDHHERSMFHIEKSLEHDVDLNRTESYSRDETAYTGMHKNYRYLIEKFVQLHPKGTKRIDVENFQYLIALIDWLHVLYSASDALWYGLDPALGMKVNDQFLVEVVYADGFSQKEKLFAQERAKEKLGIGINKGDDVSSPRSLRDFIGSLDVTFKEDFGFTFSNMISLLQVLSSWASINPQCEIAAYYAADEDEIRKTCSKSVEGFDQEQANIILRFLTLRGEDVIRILGQEEVCNDIPVWEHRKRFSRYNLRPLIFIDGKYYWGPYSTRRSGIIWSGNLSYGCLPTDLESPKIQKQIDYEKQLIEKALENKAYEIVRRFTTHVISKCILHDRDHLGGHPIDLGDYDVLAFHAEKNVVLNIECKDNLPPFCLKDAIRLKRRIFGEGNEDEGQFKQINRRKDYLSGNIHKIANGLNWPIDVRNPPRIVTIYLTRNTYWWTRFPPKDTDVEFLQTVQLSTFIEKL